ncbi:hypothetical protein AB0M43_36710 [Longispora sp. NPDC051575]|uniref:hypothetical protein n=1 Tax=Longispora sp. NPDC051575 TaxID=3154943 RepID=UPI0034235973
MGDPDVPASPGAGPVSGGVPVWLLDIDGVVNAIGSRPDRSTWPSWRQLDADCRGETWPILCAEPVLEFLRRVHDAGAAEVRWHTTWQDEALMLGELLDLPSFKVQPCPEYDNGEAVGGARPVGASWWKLPAAERVVGVEGRDLVWTDDDAQWELKTHRPIMDNPGPFTRVLNQVLVISPHQRLGLSRKHLRRIAEFLDVDWPGSPGWPLT